MPTIPIRTTSRELRDTSLGRITATNLPGIQEQVNLQQLDSLVKGGTALADTLIARKEVKQKEVNDLAINEAALSFESASRQKKLELQQRRGKDAEGVFTEFKQSQSKIWDEVTADLTPEQVKLFTPRAAKIGFEDNSQMAVFQAQVNNQRINSNFQASAVAARTRGFDSITNKERFDSNIAESLRLTGALQRRQGASEEEIENNRKKLLSSSVSEGIELMSAISLNRAETWLGQALEDGELSTPDSIKLKTILDKRKKGNEKEERLIFAQDIAGDIYKDFKDDIAGGREFIENNYSGTTEVDVKNQFNLQIAEGREQDAANQRALITDLKAVIDQSLNATQARLAVSPVLASKKATIGTANTIEAYIKESKAGGRPRTESNPTALDEVYTRINKTIAGTASPDKILSSAEQIEVEYADKLSPQDKKTAIGYLRNNGFFGKTAYNDLLQSFANMKQASVEDVRKNRAQMKEFVAYLNYARPLLPPDKVATPFTLQEISADFFRISEREGEVEGFFFDHTYAEAVEEGRELDWLPELSGDEDAEARKLLADENSIRIAQGKQPLSNTELNRSRIYKQRILLLDSAGEQ